MKRDRDMKKLQVDHDRYTGDAKCTDVSAAVRSNLTP